MWRGGVSVACAALLLVGCSGTDPGSDRPDQPAEAGDIGSPSASVATSPADATARGHGPAWRRAYDAALSEPVEDSVYPEVGDPGVDALHYDLDLTWQPEREVLTGREELAFRAAETDSSFTLDLAAALEVSGVRLDGSPVEWRHVGKNLVVDAPVRADDRHVLQIRYSGHPRSVPAPTRRDDVPSVGWSVARDGAAWTMQEPYGAYTWYAANDQPADKALYDFTLRVPAPMTGVANGVLESNRTRGGTTLTRWTLSEPAASYLVTVSFAEFESADLTAASGVPVSIWIVKQDADLLPQLRRSTVAALDWAEETLGPYPFDSLGFLFNDSTSGMETQTMITLGTSEYATSEPVLVHEVVHHWWGDQVTPADWRDVWMSEGMTTYLQKVWEDGHGGEPLDATLAQWRGIAQQLRDSAGPPADYDPRTFAESNVYLLPALMWHEIRGVLGDDEFFRLVREWPAAHDDQNADTAELVHWWQEQSGADLADIFQKHLYDEEQPS